jgi:hypothetical protein
MEKDDREPGNINISRLSELYELIKKHRVMPNRLFIVGKNVNFIIHDNTIEEFETKDEDYGLIIPRSFERGEIIDSFSKIEFFINELIRAKILGKSEDPNHDLLDVLLERLEFYSKFRMLCDDFKLINEKEELYKKILLIKDIRNSFAHIWNIKKVYYKNTSIGPLESHFVEFKEDLRYIWKELIRVYEKLINQDALIDRNINLIFNYVEKKTEKDSIFINDEEYKRLLDYVKNKYENETSQRLKRSRLGVVVAISLAGEAGLKLNEIVYLKESQLSRGFIKLGSGDLSRNVPIPTSLNEPIIKSVLPFPTKERNLQKSLVKAAKISIQKKISPQDLRGYFAYSYITKGVSPYDLAKILGLKNLGSLDIYINRPPSRLISF